MQNFRKSFHWAQNLLSACFVQKIRQLAFTANNWGHVVAWLEVYSHLELRFYYEDDLVAQAARVPAFHILGE